MSFTAIDGTINPHLVADYLPQPQIVVYNCNLYAVLGDPRTFPHSPFSALLYKSSNGITWTLLDEAHSPPFAQGDGNPQMNLTVHGTSLETLGGTTFPDTFDPNSNMKTVSFDPSSGLWGSTTRLVIVQGNTNDFLSVARSFASYRPDGSYIIASQYLSGPAEVIIKKRTVGGSWSTLAIL